MGIHPYTLLRLKLQSVPASQTEGSLFLGPIAAHVKCGH